MHLIIYTSEYTGNEDKICEELLDICSTAKKNNVKDNITGALFYHNATFLQILEGEQHKLNELLDIIKKDSRHQNIQVLIDEAVKERRYQSWNMDTFNLSLEEQLDQKELKNITAAYKKTIEKVRSDLLMRFYKAMLNSHELKDA